MKHEVIFGLAAIAMLAGCTSIPAGGEAVSAGEIEASLTGRTWLWPNAGGGSDAGIYFAPENVAIIHWNGAPWETTWSTRDGAFCYQDDDGDRCWAVYSKDGATHSFSLWQPEFREPYSWDPAVDTVRGRRIP